MKRHDELMRLTKAELVEEIIKSEKAAKTPDLAEREVVLHSPAGPVHRFHGFVDDGTGPLVIKGIPEDDLGHWAPYYELDLNGQTLGRPEIGPREA